MNTGASIALAQYNYTSTTTKGVMCFLIALLQNWTDASHVADGNTRLKQCASFVEENRNPRLDRLGAALVCRTFYIRGNFYGYPSLHVK